MALLVLSAENTLEYLTGVHKPENLRQSLNIAEITGMLQT
jgi:hypothetical protein